MEKCRLSDNIELKNARRAVIVSEPEGDRQKQWQPVAFEQGSETTFSIDVRCGKTKLICKTTIFHATIGLNMYIY